MAELTDLTEQLIQWYGRNFRALPWRSDVSPYHVWLSEIMLQQTQAATVAAYYNRFLEALPDIASLANAPEDLCLKLWEGLGYYSRIRNMRKAARIVQTEYAGALPDSIEQLQKLPGIGSYTAAAIASIAFGQPVPAIDGNLLRVFARMTACPDEIKTEKTKKLAARFFRPMMSEDKLSEKVRSELTAITLKTTAPVNLPGAVNQALMDLGAGTCLANSAPKCEACPLRQYCEAHRQEKETDYPVKAASKPRVREGRTVLVVLYDGRIAISKRPDKGLLAGLYELPNKRGNLDEAGAIRFAKELGFSPLRVRRLPDAKHIFTHREWHMTGYEVRVDELTPYVSPDKPTSPVLLIEPKQIREFYSIPSAFSAFIGPYMSNASFPI